MLHDEPPRTVAVTCVFWVPFKDGMRATDRRHSPVNEFRLWLRRFPVKVLSTTQGSDDTAAGLLVRVRLPLRINHVQILHANRANTAPRIGSSTLVDFCRGKNA